MKALPVLCRAALIADRPDLRPELIGDSCGDYILLNYVRGEWPETLFGDDEGVWSKRQFTAWANVPRRVCLHIARWTARVG